MGKVAILGASGFAKEVACNLLDLGINRSNIFFVDDFSDKTELEFNYKGAVAASLIVKNWDFTIFNVEGFVIGVGDPKTKEQLVAKAKHANINPISTIVHPSANLQGARIGVGGVIASNVVVTSDVVIGDFVILNLGTTVGHDAQIDDYVTCNPLAAISGRVTIGKGCLIGVSAAIREGVRIGENTIVGGQAFVLNDIASNSVVAGVPAKPLLRS